MATKTWYWLGLGILALSLSSSPKSSSPTAQTTRTWFGAKRNALCLRELSRRALVEMRGEGVETDFPQIGVDVGARQAEQWQAEAEGAKKEIEVEMGDQLSHMQAQHLISPEVFCPRVRVKLKSPHTPVASRIVDTDMDVDKDPI